MINRPWYRFKEYQTVRGIPLSQQSTRILQSHYTDVLTLRITTGEKWDITANSYVGRIELPDTAIQIEPKIPIPMLWEWLAWSYDLKSLLWSNELSQYRQMFGDQEWLVKFFLYECRKIYSRGIRKDYVTFEEPIESVRGQLRSGSTVHLWLKHEYRFDCRFDELTHWVLENQIIYAGLQDMSHHSYQDRKIHHDLRNMIDVYGRNRDNSRNKKSTPSQWVNKIDTLPITRLNRHYVPAFNWLRLYWKANGLSFDYGNIRTKSFILDMNELFEDYIARRLKTELQPYGINVMIQKQDYLAEGGKIKIVPDIILRNSEGQEIILDTKYIRRIDDRAINSNVFQMLAYMTARKATKGILLYAAGPERVDKIRHTDKTIYQWSLNSGADSFGSLEEGRGVWEDQFNILAKDIVDLFKLRNI